MLEKAQEEIRRTQSYNQESERMDLLKELVKEQLKNEDSSHSTR